MTLGNVGLALTSVAIVVIVLRIIVEAIRLFLSEDVEPGR